MRFFHPATAAGSLLRSEVCNASAIPLLPSSDLRFTISPAGPFLNTMAVSSTASGGLEPPALSHGFACPRPGPLPQGLLFPTFLSVIERLEALKDPPRAATNHYL